MSTAKNKMFYQMGESGSLPFSENVEYAVKGFKKMHFEAQGFHPSTLARLPLRRKTPVKGSITTYRKALDLLGVKQPVNMDIPESLKGYLHREVWTTTLGKVRNRTGRCFIKPLLHQKAFDGCIIDNGRFNAETRQLNDKLPILAAEEVRFGDEWRVYVLDNEILGICPYRFKHFGANLRKFSKEVLSMIESFSREAPAAYALDVGLIKNKGKVGLALVEVNEAFSCGNYGISNLKYAMMNLARWNELMENR